jgi:quinol monooxygenase YgiN
MAYGYIGTMRTTPGNRDQVAKILLSGAETLKSQGCSLYVVSTLDNDPDLIHVTEVWESKHHHDASLNLPETQAAIRQAMPMLTKEFTSQELTVLGGLGL